MCHRLRASRAEISVLAHATEDLKKVKHALKEVLPERLREIPNITVENLEGHYRNPIKLVRVVLANHDWATAFIEHITSSLPEDDSRSIIDSLDRYLDKEGNLFLRLDKQAAFLGRFRLRQDDAIRVKVKLLRDSPVRTSIKEGIRRLLVHV